jgi:hypothetical protein
LIESDRLHRCEHYSQDNRDHYFQVLDESYDIDYLESIFDEDADMQDILEAQALELGKGPLAACQTVMNISAQKVFCRQ